MIGAIKAIKGQSGPLVIGPKANLVVLNLKNLDSKMIYLCNSADQEVIGKHDGDEEDAR